MFGGYENVRHPTLDKHEAYFNYTCGHCGNKVSGIVVAIYNYGNHVDWLLCPSCGKGSVHSEGIFPIANYGPDIEGLPTTIAQAYLEARSCMSVNSYTASELICRNILMHIAVEKGDTPDKSFADYVSYLENNGYVTPPMKDWVKLIRQHGNKAAHILEAPDRTRAECTFMFTAELLRLVYEMNHVARKFTSGK